MQTFDFAWHLSGGQQRRVSFACSMIHNPELLILDEPTVGVDALLRQRSISVFYYVILRLYSLFRLSD